MKKILFLFLMLSTLSFSEVVKAKVIAVYGGDSFQVLIGKEKVIWRYDPIFINETYTIEKHINHTWTATFDAYPYLPDRKSVV